MPPTPPPPPPPIGGPGLNPKLVIAIIAAVLIVVAIAAYFLLLKKPTPQPVVIPAPKFTPSASPSSGLNPTEQVATLKPEAGKSGSGEASRSVLPGRFVLTVTAELPDPGQGKSYAVWLVRPEPLAQFSAGQLKQSGNRWILTLDQTRDASTYSTVTVTLQTTGQDVSPPNQVPGTKILTGSFQTTPQL